MNPIDISKLQHYVEQSADFVAEQAPLLAQEILKLGRLEYTALVVFWTVVILFLVDKIHDVAISIRLHTARDEGNAILVGFILLSSCLISTACLFTAIHNCLAAWLAPRLYRQPSHRK